MSAKVAILKPLSSAIAIGTGGPFGAEGLGLQHEKGRNRISAPPSRHP
ncbi:MAG TPA: hypothetical protein VJN39_00680 [Gemmatimonadales bacterium]|nr:hypothetical protein [Gemmatimonadales bacterium]